jgi:hypothetical protein
MAVSVFRLSTRLHMVDFPLFVHGEGGGKRGCVCFTSALKSCLSLARSHGIRRDPSL